MSISNATPVLAVDEKNLIPVSDHLKQMADIPPSRMFLINKSLKVYVEKNVGAKIFDASQGDGGASLPGTPKPILERALQLQLEHGTAYDMPFGTEAYRMADELKKAGVTVVVHPTMQRAGSTMETLHSFTGSYADGGLPRSPLTAGGAGVFYSSTMTGGSRGFGVVYQFQITDIR